MENLDANDPNLDGDFKAFIRRQKVLEDLRSTAGNDNKRPSSADRIKIVSKEDPLKTRSAVVLEPPPELLRLRTEFFKAAEEGNCDKCSHLWQDLVQGTKYGKKQLIDSELRDPSDNRTVFHHALIHKQFPVARLLMEFESDTFLMAEYKVTVNQVLSYKTALHIIVEHGQIKLAELLIRKIQKSSQKTEYMNRMVLMAMEGQRPRTFSAIHIAAFKGFTEIVDILFTQGMDVNLANKKKDTPILWAARWNHVDTASRLIELGANVNQENDKHSTALYWAVRYGHADMVKLLLERGKADINFRRKLGFEIPVVLASALGYAQILETLLENQADINKEISGGLGALHVAATYGNSDIIDILIEHNVSIEKMDNLGNTALVYAIKHGHLDACDALLIAGANLFTYNYTGETIWDVALTSKNENMLEHVIMFYKQSRRMERGTLSFPEGKTPLHVAAAKGDVKTLHLLIQQGADKHTMDHGHNTFMHIAARENKVEVLKEFMDDCDINAKNREGETPIHLACKQGNLEPITVLLKKAKLDIKSKMEETVLHVCARSPLTNIEVTQTLVDAIVKTQSWSLLDAPNIHGQTALHIAAREARTDIIKALSPLNPKLKNKEGSNPLHVAALGENTETLREMIATFYIPSKGLDINDSKQDGESLLHICAKKGDTDMVELLLEKGADLCSMDDSGNTVLHDITYQMVHDPTNRELHLEVFQAIVKNCTNWWCNKSDIYCPDPGTDMYIEVQKTALIYLLESVNNKMNYCVKSYATHLGAIDMLEAIFNIPGVFCFKEYNCYKYDITNVSPETMLEKPLPKRKHRLLTPSSIGVAIAGDDDDGSLGVPLQQMSCIDVIVKMEDPILATRVLDVTPLNFIVRDYWKVYKYIYGILMVLHIVYMSLYSVYAIPLANEIWTFNSTSPHVPDSRYGVFLLSPIFFLLFALYYAISGSITFCLERKNPNKNIKHGFCSEGLAAFMYSVIDWVFSSLQLLSGIAFGLIVILWYAFYMQSDKIQVYFLAVALIVGWLYTIAFTKGFETVHSFSIMLKYIIVRDITRFGFIYLFVLLGFALAMHALFQISPTVLENHPTAGHTFFDSFNMMIGMGEVVGDTTDDDFAAAGSNGIYLRITYLFYIILSTIILLNLLIAMMSDTYGDIKKGEGTTWRVGSVRMAVSMEKSLNIIAKVFQWLRGLRSVVKISFDETNYRYMITIPISEIEQAHVNVVPDETIKAMNKLESKINYINTHFVEMMHKVEEMSEMYAHLETSIQKIHSAVGVESQPEVRLKRRISKIHHS